MNVNEMRFLACVCQRRATNMLLGMIITRKVCNELRRERVQDTRKGPAKTSDAFGVPLTTERLLSGCRKDYFPVLGSGRAEFPFVDMQREENPTGHMVLLENCRRRRRLNLWLSAFNFPSLGCVNHPHTVDFHLEGRWHTREMNYIVCDDWLDNGHCCVGNIIIITPSSYGNLRISCWVRANS